MITDISKASLVAKVTFMSPEIGGRKRPVVSGYRGQFFYNETDCDAVHVFESEEPVPFGVGVLDYVYLTNPIHVERISVEMPILIREGSNTVAYGSIVSINRNAGDPGLRTTRRLPTPSSAENNDAALAKGSADEFEHISDRTEIDAYWLKWNDADSS